MCIYIVYIYHSLTRHTISVSRSLLALSISLFLLFLPVSLTLFSLTLTPLPSHEETAAPHTIPITKHTCLEMTTAMMKRKATIPMTRRKAAKANMTMELRRQHTTAVEHSINHLLRHLLTLCHLSKAHRYT